MRIGRIKISNDCMEDKKSLLPLFSNFIPIHVKFKQNTNEWIFTGHSDEFNEFCPIEGERYPFYSAIIKDGKCNFKST